MACSRHWYYVWANFWFQKFIINSIQGMKLSFYIFWYFSNPCDFYLPTHYKFAPPHTSPNLAQFLLSEWLWVPLLKTLLHMCHYGACSWSSPNHIPIKYRCLIKKMSHLSYKSTQYKITLWPLLPFFSLHLKMHDFEAN